MNRSSRIALPLILLLQLLLAYANPAAAQRAGQSVTIQHGIVTGGRQVDLKTGAVPKGAVVGVLWALRRQKARSPARKPATR